MQKSKLLACSLSLVLSACATSASHDVATSTDSARGDTAAAISAFEVAANAAAEAGNAAADGAELQMAIDREDRSAANRARDVYRHPFDTLRFFQVTPRSHVVEITPGGGWYTEILQPYLITDGSYTAALVDPATVPMGASRAFQEKQRDTFARFLAGKVQGFDTLKQIGFNPSAPVFAAPGSVDTILTFRNVHNWVAAGNAQLYFDAFFKALKPGGVLGVADHRAKPGTDLDTMKKTGYLTEALVIDYANRAGFVLEETSQINANPADTTDHPNGVWTLPPTNRHDAKDDAKYKAIGESDRMTLRFRKP